MAKVKQGWEQNKFYGTAGKELIRGVELGKLSPAQLQAILDGDPKNASRMIDGTPTPKKTDNKPGEPLPEKPKA
jgi:hypothetical protein